MQQALGLQRARLLQCSKAKQNLRTDRLQGRFRSSHRCSATDGDGTPSESEEDASQQLPPEDIQLAVEFYLKEKSSVEGNSGESVPPGPEDDAQTHTEETSLVEVEETPVALVEAPPPADADVTTTSTTTQPPSGDHHEDKHQQSDPAILLRLQEELLGMVASLDRGLVASKDDVVRVDNLVRQLENIGGQVVLADAHAIERLGGRWRLLYSSGFASGNLGGARPGPPAGLVPLNVGQIYQDIFLAARRLDNVVSLAAKFSLASLVGSTEPPTLTARLEHSFDVVGANTVRITYDKTVAKGSGGLGGWLDSLPEVATPMVPEPLRSVLADARSATFDVVYLDERMRITRGDRGELRIFFKEI